jgi:hypothetical protein
MSLHSEADRKLLLQWLSLYSFSYDIWLSPKLKPTIEQAVLLPGRENTCFEHKLAVNVFYFRVIICEYEY